MILLPGSTAKQVSDVSGRGVGLDVVKRQLDALRGVVTITSEPGQGATLSLRLPLTLAIIFDELLVEVDASRYILPLASVTEAVELPPGDRDCYNGRRAGWIASARTLCFTERYFRGFGGPSERPSGWLLEDAGQRVGLVVDCVLGQRQTVIQSLGHMYRSIRCRIGRNNSGRRRGRAHPRYRGVVRQAQAGRAVEMKNIDLGKRLALGFGVIAIGSGIVGALNVLTLEQIQSNVVQVRDEDIVKLELAMRLQSAVEEQAALVLRHVLRREE